VNVLFQGDKLGEILKEVRPTAFLGVPRVWEKIQEKMVAVGRSQSTLKRRIAVWAKGVGLKGNERLMNRFVAICYYDVKCMDLVAACVYGK